MSKRIRLALCLSWMTLVWTACQPPPQDVLSDSPPDPAVVDSGTGGQTNSDDTTGASDTDATTATTNGDGGGGAIDNSSGAGGSDASGSGDTTGGAGGADGSGTDTGGTGDAGAGSDTGGTGGTGGADSGGDTGGTGGTGDSGSGGDTGGTGGSDSGGDTGGTGGTGDSGSGGDTGGTGGTTDPGGAEPAGATLAASQLTRAEILAALNEIGDLTRKITETEQEQNASALRRVRAYRLLLGLRTDITIDPQDVILADAAAEICMQLGTLTHSPSRPPGMTDEEYALAQQGAAESNLATRYPLITIPYSIDLYMDDSDASNIDRVGHRRWIMSPLMAQTGFGLSSDNRYAAMHVFPDDEFATACFSDPDARQSWDYILYPRWGYMPTPYFADAQVAWSVSLRGDRYNASGVTAADISVRPADQSNTPTGAALTLNYFNRSDANYGCQHPVLIFRPQGVQVSDGRRYVVSITGITDLSGNPVPLEYWVEFFFVNPTVIP